MASLADFVVCAGVITSTASGTITLKNTQIQASDVIVVFSGSAVGTVSYAKAILTAGQVVFSNSDAAGALLAVATSFNYLIVRQSNATGTYSV
jgi:molybdopterin biosynthesis enzyme